MMRFPVLAAVIALAAIISANPVPAPDGGTVNVCAGGQAYCCASFNQPVVGSTGDLLSVPLNVILGLQCSPISVLSIVLGSTCQSSTFCCQDVSTNGLIDVQCISLSL